MTERTCSDRDKLVTIGRCVERCDAAKGGGG